MVSSFTLPNYTFWIHFVLLDKTSQLYHQMIQIDKFRSINRQLANDFIILLLALIQSSLHLANSLQQPVNKNVALSRIGVVIARKFSKNLQSSKISKTNGQQFFLTSVQT
jgi:hypothetical protein